jgi:hypothetical protein
MDAGRPLADWRSDAAYAPLTQAGRHAFAWEWLRRSAAYHAGCDPAAFGLCRYEPNDLIVPAARPIWRADADPAVLRASAIAGDTGDRFDIAALGIEGARCVDDGGEHWLWSDGLRSIRLDLIDGSLRAGPVEMVYHLRGCADAQLPAETLLRLIALARNGGIVRRLFRPEPRAERWALVLRVHDALLAGATHRDIAEHVFGLEPVTRWRIEAPSWRQRAVRLVEAARKAAQVDPRAWLRGDYP